MSAAVVTIVVAVVGVIGTILGAAVSAWLNRDRDDAEIATKISDAWEPVFVRVNEQIDDLKVQCSDCKTALNLVRIDFGHFTDVIEELVPLLPPGEPQRKARVAITAARLSHLTHS